MKRILIAEKGIRLEEIAERLRKWGSEREDMELKKKRLQSSKFDKEEIHASVGRVSEFFRMFENRFKQAPACERKALVHRLVDRIEVARGERFARCYLPKLPKGEAKVVDEMLEKERTHPMIVPPTRFELVFQA